MLLSSTKKGFPKHRRVVMSDWKSSPNMGEHKKHVWNHHLEISKNTGKFRIGSSRRYSQNRKQKSSEMDRFRRLEELRCKASRISAASSASCKMLPWSSREKKKDFPPSPKTNIDNGTSTIPSSKMYFLLNIGIFQWHVSFQGCKSDSDPGDKVWRLAHAIVWSFL